MITWQHKGTFAASADYDADNRIRHLVGYTLPAEDSGVQLVGLVMDGSWGTSTQEEGGQMWMTSLDRVCAACVRCRMEPGAATAGD